MYEHNHLLLVCNTHHQLRSSGTTQHTGSSMQAAYRYNKKQKLAKGFTVFYKVMHLTTHYFPKLLFVSHGYLVEK